MKIIDLLNKIANGEEVPIEIVYNGEHYYNTGTTYENGSNENVLFWYEVYNEEHLNDEIEIIEEDKKIEKIPYYSLEKIQKAKNKEQWYEERISLLEERIENQHEKINELIDYINKKENDIDNQERER